MVPVEKEWRFRTPDPDRVRHLCDTLDCRPIVAKLLVNRGFVNPREAERVLAPSLDILHDPLRLPDMHAGVERIREAIANGESITVYGDRDVDGITGTAILLLTIEELDGTVGYAFPGEYDGHGVHDHVISDLDDRGTDLVVTVDCGTDDRHAIEHANALGMDVIVTDHHDPSDHMLPADICVNPQLERSAYPNGALSGAGIAYKVGHALLQHADPDLIQQYHRYALPLTGIGTVVDRVRLTQENHALARLGYDRIDECPLPGLTALVDHCGLSSVRDIGWSLGPLLNAALEDDSDDLMLRIVLAQDADRIEEYIANLEEYREQRRNERREWSADLASNLDAQLAATDDILLVETDEYAVPAASDVSRRLGKPVIAYHAKGDRLYGGGRTDPDIDLRALFDACDECLHRSWGHPGAAGFEVDRENWEVFLGQLRTELHRRYTDRELTPHIEIDARLAPEEITEEVVRAIDGLRPFGTGYDEPRIALEGIEVVGLESFGTADEHRILTSQEAMCRLVWWNGARALERWSGPGSYDLVGAIEWDSFTSAPAFSVRELTRVG